MKNRYIDVTPEMRERIKSEMKRHKQTNSFIAEYLHLVPTQVSRIFNSQSGCALEYISKLSQLWGVRENYLLCKDNYRTHDDIVRISGKQLSERNKAVKNLLELSGYKFEQVELLIISNADIAKFKNKEKELRFIQEHITEDYGTDIYEFLNQSVERKKDSAMHHVFEMSGGLLEEYLTPSNAGHRRRYETIKYVGFWTEIIKDGKLIGYVKYIDDYLNILGENMTTLFSSLLKSDKTKFTEWKMIY